MTRDDLNQILMAVPFAGFLIGLTVYGLIEFFKAPSLF